MATKLLSSALLVLLLLVFSVVHADRRKFEKLSPADPPCLYLLDENSGEPTGDAMNPPCELGGTIVNPGDTTDPVLRKKFGKTKAAETGSPKPVRGRG